MGAIYEAKEMKILVIGAAFAFLYCVAPRNKGVALCTAPRAGLGFHANAS